MTTIDVTTREQLKELYDDSALTWEGLSLDSLDDVKRWMKEHGAELKTERAFVTKGKTMNELEGLTGSNAYPDDLNIVSFMLKDIENTSALAIPRARRGWTLDGRRHGQHYSPPETVKYYKQLAPFR